MCVENEPNLPLMICKYFCCCAAQCPSLPYTVYYCTGHYDKNASGFPQVTTGLTSVDANGAQLLVDLSRRKGRRRLNPSARIIEIVRTEAGHAFSHIVNTESCYHRVRTLTSGERFVCCLYVPALAVPFSAHIVSKYGADPPWAVVALAANKEAVRIRSENKRRGRRRKR